MKRQIFSADWTTSLLEKQEDSVLQQHSLTHHPHGPLVERDFKLEVTSEHSTAMGRQAEEGARIMLTLANDALDRLNTNRKEEERYKRLVLLNSNSEFHQTFTEILGKSWGAFPERSARSFFCAAHSELSLQPKSLINSYF